MSEPQIVLALYRLCVALPLLSVLAIGLAQAGLLVLAGVVGLVWLWPGPGLLERRQAAVAAALGGALALAAIALLASPVMRPRPFVALGITPLFPHDADSSFPSDHTLVGVALATPLVVRRIAGRWAAFILALGIGLARVAAAVHWPSDVLVSAALAVGLGALASWLVSCLLRMAPVQVWLQRSALLRRLAPLAGLPSA